MLIGTRKAPAVSSALGNFGIISRIRGYLLTGFVEPMHCLPGKYAFLG